MACQYLFRVVSSGKAACRAAFHVAEPDAERGPPDWERPDDRFGGGETGGTSIERGKLSQSRSE